MFPYPARFPSKTREARSGSRASRPHHTLHLLRLTYTPLSQLSIMVPPEQRQDRDRKLKALLGQCYLLRLQTSLHSSYAAFASSLSHRLSNPRDTTLLSDICSQINSLPLPASPAVSARQHDLDRLGTELWNLAIRLRRDQSVGSGKTKDDATYRLRTLSHLRCYSFLLLDTAGSRGSKGEQYRNCIRLMKVALKAANVCIDDSEFESATKVLERAAEYQDVLSKSERQTGEEAVLADRLRAEYFAIRTTLVSTTDTLSRDGSARCNMLRVEHRHGASKVWIWQSTSLQRGRKLPAQILSRAPKVLEICFTRLERMPLRTTIMSLQSNGWKEPTMRLANKTWIC
jgi:hypothetical protein